MNKFQSVEASALKGLFTWSGGPRSSGIGFFCFHALADTKQKKPTPLDRGPPLHVNRVLGSVGVQDSILFFAFFHSNFSQTGTEPES